MRIESLAIAELAPETVVAMHGFGREGGDPIEGHQELIAKEAKIRQHAVLLKGAKDLNKHRSEVARSDRTEQRVDLIVTGNPLHIEQDVGVILPFGVLQPALILRKRWRLRVKDAKGAQSGILDRVSGVGTRFAMVR